jgi:LysR family transcriptional regulator, transcription activator of glutamate synthase operon
MDIQQIKYFLALSEELHFWNTAAKINITQSALTRQIQSLENEMGIQLFERNKRNVKLTPAGEFLKEKWEVEMNKLDFIHRFAKQIQLGENGTIKIAHPDSISASIMPEILLSISEQYPHLHVELLQVRYGDQLEFLRNYKIDLLITRDINTAEDVLSKKIYSDHLSVVVRDDHPFRHLKDITKTKLAKEKFILPIRDVESSYSDIVQEFFRSFGIVPDAPFQSEFGSAPGHPVHPATF